MRHLGVLTPEKAAKYYAAGDLTLQQWLQQFGISLTASARPPKIQAQYSWRVGEWLSLRALKGLPKVRACPFPTVLESGRS